MNPYEAMAFARKKFTDRGIASAPLDAEVLLLETLNQARKNKMDKTWLYLNLNKYELTEKEEATFRKYIKHREKNEPIAYIIGKKEFYGLDFFVDKNVLIPRPETEMIVDESLEIIRKNDKDFTLLDIGTGSGCIAISMADAMRKCGMPNKLSKVFVNDISAEAIKVARINAKKHGSQHKIIFLRCDLEEALDKISGSSDVIITANLPYIPPEKYVRLTPNVKRFEPKIALTTKSGGLYHIERLIRKFSEISQKSNSFHILLEADPAQMKKIEKLAKLYIPKCSTRITRDMRGKKRMIKISAE